MRATRRSGVAELTNERAGSPHRLRIGRTAPAFLPSRGRGAPRRDWDRRSRYARVPRARARSCGGRGGRSRAVQRWSRRRRRRRRLASEAGAGTKDCEVGNREFLDSLSGILSAVGELSFVQYLEAAGAAGSAAAVAQR